jgi:hypothetical protein
LEKDVAIFPIASMKHFGDVAAKRGNVPQPPEHVGFVADTLRGRFCEWELDISEDFPIRAHDLYCQFAKTIRGAQRQGKNRFTFSRNFLH